jgi:outer membrane lipoprotein-sorting protein
MKNKHTHSLLILASVGLLVTGCSSSSYSASPEMKTFFDGISASKAYNAISTVSVTVVYKSYDGNGDLVGTKNGGYEFSKGDEYYLHKKYIYTGDQVVDDVTSSEYLGGQASDGLYYEWNITNGDTTSMTKTSILNGNIQTAIQELVYINTGTYNTGGLYYGDIFMVNSNTFPNDAFVIDDEKETMSFVYKYAKKFTNESDQEDYIQIDENTCMDKNGLVQYSYEEVSFALSKELGHSEMVMTYNEPLDKVSF